MIITIIGVGKIKDKALQSLILNYTKQMKQIEIIEIQDEPQKQGIAKEGLKILDKIPKDSYVVVLAIEGQTFDSVAFSQKLDHIMMYHGAHITFIIGGSYGLSDTVKERANLLLSFSKMTLPHQLMRLVLVEQIYRAQAILNNHPYHK